MAEMFESVSINRSHYVPWDNVIFHVRVQGINGRIIFFAEIVAFVGDTIVPPESDII